MYIGIQAQHPLKPLLRTNLIKYKYVRGTPLTKYLFWLLRFFVLEPHNDNLDKVQLLK